MDKKLPKDSPDVWRRGPIPKTEGNERGIGRSPKLAIRQLVETFRFGCKASYRSIFVLCLSSESCREDLPSAMDMRLSRVHRVTAFVAASIFLRILCCLASDDEERRDRVS